MTEKLIISVSAFPEIFNTTLASKDRTVKAKAWLKVSKEVGLTGKERRRQEAGKRSGTAAGPLKTWKYSAVLSFLGPFVTPRETSSNMVLGVEVDGIAEYPVEDHGSEAAAGTANDLGASLSEDEHFFKGIIPSLQRLPPHAKEHIQFQIYKLLHDCCVVFTD
uniref:BESS domain-containing protein n=1 Tax=Gadus morhua TaxID=8049 RepID=A0A8C5FE63_GADMO